VHLWAPSALQRPEWTATGVVFCVVDGVDCRAAVDRKLARNLKLSQKVPYWSRYGHVLAMEGLPANGALGRSALMAACTDCSADALDAEEMLARQLDRF